MSPKRHSTPLQQARKSRGWSLGRLVAEIEGATGERIDRSTLMKLERQSAEGRGTLRIYRLAAKALGMPDYRGLIPPEKS